MFIDKVQAVENKFMDLEQRISDPSVIARQEEWQKLTREHASLSPIVEAYRQYKQVTEQIRDDRSSPVCGRFVPHVYEIHRKTAWLEGEYHQFQCS